MRFKKDVYNRENFCREFTISSKPVPPEKILFYDCLWSLNMSEEVYYFEFKANDVSTSIIGKYYFEFKANDVSTSSIGKYYFTAKINHTNCTKEFDCYVSKSPPIVIKGMFPQINGCLLISWL
jgi:hypothetical protein